MPFNINSFKTNIEKFGYLDNNSFEMLISMPKVMSSSGNDIAKNLKLRIDQVRIPGLSAKLTENFRYGIGIETKQPYYMVNDQLTFSILVDKKGAIWQFFYNWMRKTFEFSGTEDPTSGNVNTVASYTAEYKDNFSSIMQVIIYDQFGNDVQAINFFEAFPVAIREMPYNWGDPNLVKLNVACWFTEYIIVPATPNNATNRNQQASPVLFQASNVTT